MLPSKLVAVAFVGILAMGAYAGVATAQPLPTGADLIVERVEIGTVTHPRVANVPQHVNITVRNQGDTDFQSPTGWQIFVGLGGKTTSACIEPGDTDEERAASGAVGATVLSPCFIRMTPTGSGSSDGSNQSRVPARTSQRYTLMWNATSADHKTWGDNAWIWVEIGNLGAEPGQPASECDGPDGAAPAGNCHNNQYNLTGVSIGHLGVRSTPLRLAPRVDATPNDAWRDADIEDPCPISPDVVTRGCEAMPGKSIVALYEVRNVGTVDDSYVPHFRDENDYYARHGYTFDYAPRVVALGRGEASEVRVTIFVPENETAGNKTNVDVATHRIKWSSTRVPWVATDTPTNPGCDDAAFKKFCVNPTLPSFRVDHRRSFNVTSNETFWQIIPGATQKFNLTINNTGNAPDTFNVSFDNSTRTINDSWTPIIENPGEIQPGKTANASISITAPRNATNTTYWFEVTIKSQNDEGETRCKVNEVLRDGVCTLRFAAHLAQSWAIAGVSDAAYRVVPGETKTYNLGIRNNGNGYDNVSLELQGTVGGWDVRLSNTSVRLTPFNLTPFTLTVTSPPNTLANTEASFFVNATATGPIETPLQLHSKAVTQSTMTIISGPNIRLDAPINSTFIDRGREVEYTLHVTNVGNVADNFTIPVPEKPSSWSVGVDPIYVELQPNEQKTVKVTLGAPNSSVVGEKASAIVTVLSTVDRARQKQIALEARVSGPDLFVDSISTSALTPYTGDTLDVTVAIGNAGNRDADKPTNLRVYFLKDGVEYLIGNKTYEEFSIRAQQRLTETFTWDTTGIEGTGTIVARIDGDDLIREIDDSAASNERARDLTIRVFDIKLTPAEGLSGRPGQEIVYSEAPNVFLVEYRGNQPDEPVLVRIESENGWLSSPAEVPLKLVKGTPLIITPKLRIPALPGTASDTLTITVVPSNRPSEVLRATTITTVIDEEKPLVTRIEMSPAAGKLGEPVRINVHVEDATGVAAVTAYITGPTNVTTALTLSRVAAGHWAANGTFAITGTYRVSAEATDAASPPNLNNTRETIGTFSLVPGSSPTIRLAAGQSSTVRTGALIALDIRDPVGVGRASFAIKGVTYEFKAPGYRIDTSTFQAGEVEVRVTAENIHGVSSSESFTFTIDNTPGEITRVTMSPQRPRPDAEVTLTIQAAAEVEAVDVLIKRDGQVVETLNATRRGVGTFEVKFNTPKGEYTIDVTARDAAGNTKLAEGAVVFSAKSGSPFGVPGAPVWALLAAVAALALLAGRRARR